MRFVARAVRAGVLGLVLGGAAAALAHYTWLSPLPSAPKVGETVTVRLASGHAFPAGEGPVSGLDLKMTVFDPSGRAVVVPLADGGRGLEAAFEPGIEGVYRAACEYDRGLISRTPEGWKPGGRTRYPEATGILKSYSSFLFAIGTSGASLRSSAPLGLAFELSWTREEHGFLVRATTKGRPVEGAEIAVIIGSGEARPAGKTDASGGIAIEIPEAFRGELLLTGSISRPAPTGSDYDEERMSASFYLPWK